jgi:hypothetical protein
MCPWLLVIFMQLGKHCRQFGPLLIHDIGALLGIVVFENILLNMPGSINNPGSILWRYLPWLRSQNDNSWP